ncbi:MAG: hypothetical protein QM772_11060 [Ottowia sp.]|uniref:hypothetical protein n=1 Tax=Ottowia sp. TaxID=1898956 RepID=UPI0039E37DA7
MNMPRVLFFVLSCLLVVGVFYAAVKPAAPTPAERAPAAVAPSGGAIPATATRR